MSTTPSIHLNVEQGPGLGQLKLTIELYNARTNSFDPSSWCRTNHCFLSGSQMTRGLGLGFGVQSTCGYNRDVIDKVWWKKVFLINLDKTSLSLSHRDWER